MRRVLLLIVGPLLLAITVAVLWSMGPADPINATNCDRIQPGMTKTEVENILGGPGDEGQGDLHTLPMSWQGRGRNVIAVEFVHQPNGYVVMSTDFFNPSLWDRAKEWWGGYELHPGGGRSKRVDGA